jgi:hypothetical protein
MHLAHLFRRNRVATGSFVTCGRGGIGRRAALRSLWGNPWKFESSRPHHHKTALILSAYLSLRPNRSARCGRWLFLICRSLVAACRATLLAIGPLRPSPLQPNNASSSATVAPCRGFAPEATLESRSVRGECIFQNRNAYRIVLIPNSKGGLARRNSRRPEPVGIASTRAPATSKFTNPLFLAGFPTLING